MLFPLKQGGRLALEIDVYIRNADLIYVLRLPPGCLLLHTIDSTDDDDGDHILSPGFHPSSC